jgi:hypothetical protein
MERIENPNAQALGRLGGKARTRSLTDAEITRIASQGGNVRPQSCLLLSAPESQSWRYSPVKTTRGNGAIDMRKKKQNGQILQIGDRWYVRYWERRNEGGSIERKRVTQLLGLVKTRGKRPPADIEAEAERHMAMVNSGAIDAERIVTVGDFVERIYRPGLTFTSGRQQRRDTATSGRII